MKFLFYKTSILLLFAFNFTFSQIGIGNTDPKSTLDITATNATGTTTNVDGIIIPRVTRERAQSMTAANIATATMIYINEVVTGSTTGTTANVTAIGFYFFNGTTWEKITTGPTTNWSLIGNSGTTAGTNFIGTNDVQDFVIKTSTVANTPIERIKVTSAGNVGINATTPTATALLTINPNTNTIRSGIDMTMTNAISAATGLNITAGADTVNGITVTHNSASTSASFYGIGSVLSSTNIVSGYNGYRNSTGKSYGLYGVNGIPGTYATNANTWAAFLQGRTVISSDSAPTSSVGTDLEIQNTTTGAAAPATVSLRQTNQLPTTGTVMANLNFGDNYATTPQARIQVLRDAAGGSGDMPTAMTFATTPDGSSILTERMRIDNAGNVGIGTNAPTTILDVNGALSLREGIALTFAAGANTPSLATSPSSVYRIIGPSSAFRLTSLTPVTSANGQIVTLINTTSQDFTIVNNSGASVNSISCPGASDLTLSGISSTVTLMYNTSSSRWIVIGSSDNPYGRNLKSSKGTSDITTTTNGFADMSDMTITFTPKHNTVYVNFSASGDIDIASGSPQGYVQFKVLKDGTSVGGTVSLGTDLDYDDLAGTTIVSAWNAHFTMYPVTVTSGTSTTIKIQWMRDGFGLGSKAARNRVTTNPDYSHRSLTIYD